MRNINNCKKLYWCSRIVLIIMMVVLYFTNTDMSVYLLRYEIKNGFIDNERWPVIATFLFVLYILESVVNYLIVTNKVRLVYIITTKKTRVNTYKIYVTNLLRMINVAVIFISLITIIVVGFDTILPSHNNYKWTEEKIIGHSFGAIDGNTYTGCLEAFEEKYNEGIRTFEVDFSRTSDGYIVLRHDWEIELQDFGMAGHVATLEEFKEKKILDKYTPLTLDDLLLIMKKYEDVWIVTDSKNQDPLTARKDFEDIVSAAKTLGCEECLDRIVVQFYNEDMYTAIRDVYDFKGYIFTLYMRWDSSYEQYRELVKWCASKDIHVITMWSELATNIDIITYAKMYDIDIYVHTVNDVEEARNRLYCGVKGIYTDDITPEILK